MSRTKRDRKDLLLIQDGAVLYEFNGKTVWSFAVSELWVMAEWTDDHEPWCDDYYYAFIAGRPAQCFESPMYANPAFMREIGGLLDETLEPGLVESTEFASRIIWPEELKGKPFFAYSMTATGAGLLNRLKDGLFPLVHSELTEEVLKYAQSRAV